MKRFLLLAAMVCAAPASAHHSFGVYFDADKPVKLSGIVTRVDWRNPHTHLYLDVNAQADTGRVALHGAAHKGRADVIQILADHGAKLDVRDYGNTDNRGGKLAVHTWQAVDYADGLVRVGVQSAIAHPEAGALLRKLMAAQGLPVPPMGRTLESICITEACE